jgi:DDE family transposase
MRSPRRRSIWTTTDDPLHGDQEGRFFHGYYGHYCYLPLYFFCGDRLLCARLREADEEPATGCVEELSRIVGQVRAAWPEVRIVLRGIAVSAARGSWVGARPYVLGLAKNSRLTGVPRDSPYWDV